LLTRFAPAPTGWLHLGHVLNAEYVWGAAGKAGGGVLLRIEDHDRTRSRPEFEAGILDDLDWLGYRPDVFPTNAFRAGRCDGRQSDRDSIYREALEILRAQGLVYACNCSRRALADASSAPGSSAVSRQRHASIG
jgi:glutamyl/glutaminyl-tRNA synthetase